MPLLATRRLPSGERPPALTAAWMWGWKRNSRVYGVQHHRHGGKRAELSRVAGQCRQRLQRGLKEHREERLAVVPNDRPQRFGQREDGLEAARRENAFVMGFEPSMLVEALARRAVPVAARVVDQRRMAAGVAGREVAAERSGAAAGERHEHPMIRAPEGGSLAQRIHEEPHDVARLHPPGGVALEVLGSSCAGT